MKFTEELILKKILFLAILVVLNLKNAHSYPRVPNPQETYGTFCDEKNPDFVEFRYAEKIAYCVRNVSSQTKNQIYEKYQIPKECRHRYTIDHFIPLAIGGSNEENNLWPEHKLVKATRPKLEIDLYIALRDGKIKQKEAIRIIEKEKTKGDAVSGLEASDCDTPSDN